MITIYGNQRCGWCKRAKSLAEMYNLKYEWLDTDDANNLANLKSKLPEVKTIPQIWWNDNHIGGYEQFATEIENAIGGYGDQTF